MNAKQRRYRRRVAALAFRSLIDGVERAAEHMRQTGQTITPEECDQLADGLRMMLKGEPEWEQVARGRA